MKNILLIYNPRAGNGMFKNNLDLIIERFQKRDMVLIPIRAGSPEMLDHVMKNIHPENVHKIIAAGGDGTINVVVNFMIKYNIDIPLAVFPAGTANDFAYYFDLPTEIEEMVNIAMEECYTYADVGKCNNRYFINVAAMGSVVDVSQKTDSTLKNALGIVAYYLRGIGELHNLKPAKFTFESEEFSGSEHVYFMVVMNGSSAGGFRKLGNKSSINDGKFDVIVFKEMPLIELFPLAINVLQGRHDGNKNVLYFQTSKLHLEVDQVVGTDVDGEKGETFPMDIEIIPRRLRINTKENDVCQKKW